MRESGVVSRLTKASENEIANVVTLLLGISIGGGILGDIIAAFVGAVILLLVLRAIRGGRRRR